MSTTVVAPRLNPSSAANRALKVAVGLWFAVAVVGQWSFLYYLVAFYGRSTLTGNYQLWTKNKFLRMSYVPGDKVGNFAFASHVLMAAVIAFGGGVQLIPYIRRRAISVHRWIGRVFFVTALALSVSGLYMEWVRGDRANMASGLGISGNAVLIILFCVLAWRSARAHQISVHRRWALRAYLVANGQWFIRVGFMAWYVISRGLFPGVAERLDSPFGSFLDWGCYLVPLGVLELYLFAKERGRPAARWAVAGGFVMLSLLTAVGIFGFTMLWRPIVASVR